MTPTVASFILKPDQAMLVVVDVQTRLLPAMDPTIAQKTVSNIKTLMEGCSILGVPILATEQYPRGLGETVTDLAGAKEGGLVTKTAFSCCGEASFLEAIKRSGRTQIIITGMETHVCVYQTVLDLLKEGYDVHVVANAVCSRFTENYKRGLRNAERAGAILSTVEMALFQMTVDAARPEFKAISALVK